MYKGDMFNTFCHEVYDIFGYNTKWWAFYLLFFSSLSKQQDQSCRGLGVLLYKFAGFLTLFRYIKFKKIGEKQRDKTNNSAVFCKGLLQGTFF